MKPERQVVFPARERAEVARIDRDTAPLAPDEVRGHTLASIVSAGTELAGAFLGEHFPAHPGYAAAFRIEETGSAVSSMSVGDLAFTMGPHRSFQRAKESVCVRVPDGMPAEHAVFGRMMAVSMTTLTTTSARPPEKVIVTGLGLVGHLAAQTFSSCGYDVTGVDPSDDRRRFATEAGIPTVLSTVPLDDPAYADRVSLVVECSGHEKAALDACRIVKKRGEVVLVGCPWVKKTDHTAWEILYAVFHRYVVLRSGWEWELPLHESDFRTNSVYGNFLTAMKWAAGGRVKLDGLYDLVPPEHAQEVYDNLRALSARRLAVVFDWREDA